MAETGFIKKKDISRLTLKSLYDKVDLTLVPNQELQNWLVTDNNKKLCPVIEKKFKKCRNEIVTRLSQFSCIGIHFKNRNEFMMCTNDNKISGWILDSTGRSYGMYFYAEYNIIKDIAVFSKILFNEHFFNSALCVFKDYRKNDINNREKTILKFAEVLLKFFGYYAGYYALNPFIIYEDITTESAEKTGHGTPHKKRENNVVPLTMNHIRIKIRNGINVINTETGRLYPSIAEAARELHYNYSSLWNFLINNWMTDLKRIEKLRIININ